jgi:hypothetical protein
MLVANAITEPMAYFVTLAAYAVWEKRITIGKTRTRL